MSWDEGVERLAVQAVEPVAEPAQRDGVEGHGGHVVGDVHDVVVVVEPGPLRHQLVGDVEHGRHVVPHRRLAERRHEDVVRLLPDRVVVGGGEQATAGRALTGLFHPCGQLLVEGGVVADLVHHGRVADEDPCLPADRDLIDRSVFLGELHEALDRALHVEIEDIAEERHTFRSADVVERHSVSHVQPFPFSPGPPLSARRDPPSRVRRCHPLARR
jgi:hypothetical protein